MRQDIRTERKHLSWEVGQRKEGWTGTRAVGSRPGTGVFQDKGGVHTTRKSSERLQTGGAVGAEPQRQGLNETNSHGKFYKKSFL